ncbi:hypothetical protein [Nostoc sp. KVJ3]|nr:hypothetical protein [Nostoc sp. KVJ3]
MRSLPIALKRGLRSQILRGNFEQWREARRRSHWFLRGKKVNTA